MLLIVEIALTVAAWKKGWKALALAPLAIAIAVAVFATQSGMNPQGMIVLDLGAIAILGFMCAKGKEQSPTPGWGAPPAQQGWTPPAQQSWTPQAQQAWTPQAQNPYTPNGVYTPAATPGYAPMSQSPTLLAPPIPAQKTCGRCGTPAPTGHGFCVGCGNSLA